MQKTIKIPHKIHISYNLFINTLNITGPLGETKLQLNTFITINLEDQQLILKINTIKHKKFLNLFYSLIKQKIKGLNQGFKEKIYLKGIGFKFILNTQSLALKIGYSHLIDIPIPTTINLFLNQSTNLLIISKDYHELTQFIALIKKKKKNDPYKGKGIFKTNEFIKLKEGKKKKKI